MSVSECRLVDLPKIMDQRGNLTFVEGGRHMPFDIRRLYYLWDVPRNAERGAHGHRALEQLIIPVFGSFDVELDDGVDRATFHMNDPAKALYVCPMMWRDLRSFSFGAVVLVLASEFYDEGDYFRDYQEFLKAALNQ